MIKSKVLKTVALLITIISCNAQSDLQSSLFMVDLYRTNPAYAGFDRSISANFNYKTVWTGLTNNPTNVNANVHMPLYLLNGGVGLSIAQQKSGSLTFSQFNLSYNRVQSFNGGIISLGLRFGIKQIGINGSDIRTTDGIYDGTFSHEDPILTTNNLSGISPDWTIGLFTRTDYFDFGLTLENLFFSEAKIESINFVNSKILSLYGAIPLYINELEIIPYLYIKSNFDQIQTNIAVNVKSGNIFGGLGLRGFNENSKESIFFLGGIKLNEHYTLSYAYDFIINELSNFSQGTHEININYNLNKLIGIGLPPEIIYNPRHF